jgi:hypothetical protein
MNQPRLGIGIVSFIETRDELPELKRCLDSIESFFPVILIDGKWKDYPSEITTSIIEVDEIIDNYSNIIHIKSPNLTEAQNRNKYLKFDMDYMIILDTDEYLEFPLGFEFFLRGLDDMFRNKSELCAFAHAESEQNGGYVRMPRIIKHPNILHYGIKHNELLIGKKNVLKYPLNAPRGLIIHHDKTLRTENRKEKMINRNKNNPIH